MVGVNSYLLALPATAFGTGKCLAAPSGTSHCTLRCDMGIPQFLVGSPMIIQACKKSVNSRASDAVLPAETLMSCVSSQKPLIREYDYCYYCQWILPRTVFQKKTPRNQQQFTNTPVQYSIAESKALYEASVPLVMIDSVPSSWRTWEIVRLCVASRDDLGSSVSPQWSLVRLKQKDSCVGQWTLSRSFSLVSFPFFKW